MSNELDDLFNPKKQNIEIGDSSANLLACGKNENSELTFIDISFVNQPTGVKFSKKYQINDVFCRGNHTALLTDEGFLFMVGSTLVNKLGIDTLTAQKISTPQLFPLSRDNPVQ